MEPAHDITTPSSLLAEARPEIDTIWFDLSVRLILFEHISGITRTIERLYYHIKPSAKLDVRYCVVLPTIGFGEVDRSWIEQALMEQTQRRERPKDTPQDEVSLENPTEEGKPSSPAEAVTTPLKKKSRFGFIPWRLRHAMRNLYWQPPDVSEQQPIKPHVPPPGSHEYYPYPYGAVARKVQLGSRDLFLSLGGQWIVAGTDDTLVKKKATFGFKHVSLIYDMIPTTAPHLSPHALSESTFTKVTHNQCLSSDVILTISEYSKKEIQEYCHAALIPTPPVEVIYLGSNIPSQNTLSLPPARQEFILTVGSVEARKNQFFLYYVWRDLIARHGKDKVPKLVVAGKPGWLGDVFFAMAQRDPVVKQHIIFKSDPSDRELNWLYTNCLFTVYPSTYEGWGLPVEESFVYGKLCITTTASSLPEVGCDFADYVPAESLEPLTAAIEKALDPAYRASREQWIREKFKPHTWEQCGEQTHVVLHRYFKINPPPPA